MFNKEIFFSWSCLFYYFECFLIEDSIMLYWQWWILANLLIAIQSLGKPHYISRSQSYYLINRETKNRSFEKFFFKFWQLYFVHRLALKSKFSNSSYETMKIHMIFKKMIHVSPLKVKIWFMPSDCH